MANRGQPPHLRADEALVAGDLAPLGRQSR